MLPIVQNGKMPLFPHVHATSKFDFCLVRFDVYWCYCLHSYLLRVCVYVFVWKCLHMRYGERYQLYLWLWQFSNEGATAVGLCMDYGTMNGHTCTTLHIDASSIAIVYSLRIFVQLMMALCSAQSTTIAHDSDHVNTLSHSLNLLWVTGCCPLRPSSSEWTCGCHLFIHYSFY